MAEFSQLKSVLSGKIILWSENEKAYQQKVDETWNAGIRTRKPAAFIRVASVEDVANTIKFCVQNEVSTSTSHLPTFFLNFLFFKLFVSLSEGAVGYCPFPVTLIKKLKTVPLSSVLVSEEVAMHI